MCRLSLRGAASAAAEAALQHWRGQELSAAVRSAAGAADGLAPAAAAAAGTTAWAKWWAFLADSFPDSGGLCRFAEAVIRTMAAPPSPPPGAVPSRRSWADAEAEAALHCLFGRALWSRPQLRLLFSDRLLLRAPCPRPALRWLLRLSLLAPPPPPPEQQAADGQPTARAGTAEGYSSRTAHGLTDTWAHPGFPAKASPQLQAYVTAALVGVLTAPGSACGGALAADSGSLLSGVSARLESPLAPVRLHAMRVGRALAAAMRAGASLNFEELEELQAGTPDSDLILFAF